MGCSTYSLVVLLATPYLPSRSRCLAAGSPRTCCGPAVSRICSPAGVPAGGLGGYAGGLLSGPGLRLSHGLLRRTGETLLGHPEQHDQHGADEDEGAAQQRPDRRPLGQEDEGEERRTGRLEQSDDRGVLLRGCSASRAGRRCRRGRC